jgi:two-component system KDP operon response regulator KdpE
MSRAIAVKTRLVLVVEDENAMVRLLRRTLELEGYRVRVAEDGPTAVDLATDPELALVVLDLRLPGLDGLTVLQHIREFSDVPVIIVTALGRTEDAINGLDAGADDYVAKPFDTNYLMARVRALLRRAQPGEDKPRAAYEYDGLAIDFAWHCATLHGERLRLSKMDDRLLAALASHPGLPHTPEQLLETVWGPEYRTADRQILLSAINRLRNKLEPEPRDPKRWHYVITEAGIGYSVPKPS